MKIDPIPLTRSNAPNRPVLKHLVFTSDPSQRQEMKDWVLHHVVGAYATDNHRYAPGQYRLAYRFELEDDAFRFKMWWG